MALIHLKEEVFFTEIEGDLKIVNISNDEFIFTLSGVSKRIFELLRELDSFDEVSAQIAMEYDVQASTVIKDIQKLIDQLQTNQIVE